MKFHVLALLPLGFVLSSCFPDPYYSQQQGPPPGYGGGGYNPYGGNGGYRSPQSQPYDGYQQPQGGYQGEQGNFQPIGPRQGNTPPPPDVTSRPIPPTYDPDPGNSGPSNPAPTSRPNYPTAQKTDTPGNVISPYPPYNVIDASGIKSGHLAKDPSNGKTFKVP